MSDRFTPRIPCPVCLGGRMAVVAVETEGADLVLDHCERCGGVWFDGGEVAALRALGPRALLTRVRPRAETHRMRCRSCEALVDRDDERCPACAHPSTLDCPRCDGPMRICRTGGLRLDVCGDCRGVWLDNHELKEVWKLGLMAAASRSVVAGGDPQAATGGSAAGAAAEALLYAPDLAFYGLHAAAEVAGAAASGAGGALDALGAAAEAVFEIIVAAVSSI